MVLGAGAGIATVNRWLESAAAAGYSVRGRSHPAGLVLANDLRELDAPSARARIAARYGFTTFLPPLASVPAEDPAPTSPAVGTGRPPSARLAGLRGKCRRYGHDPAPSVGTSRSARDHNNPRGEPERSHWRKLIGKAVEISAPGNGTDTDFKGVTMKRILGPAARSPQPRRLASPAPTSGPARETSRQVQHPKGTSPCGRWEPRATTSACSPTSSWRSSPTSALR